VATPLIVLDADTLGRQRTGDERYVANLLRELPGVADDLRFAAITRRPELVPDGVEAIQLDAGSQLYRMSRSLPRLLHGIAPELAHFQYAVPLGYRRRSVVTVHDLSFEGDPGLTSRRDRFVFRRAVRASVKRADAILTVSEFTRGELLGAYGLEPERVVALPNGLDPVFNGEAPPQRVGAHDRARYALFVGTLHPRKDPLTAVEAIALVEPDLDLLMVGPDKGEAGAVSSAVERLGLRGRVRLLGHVKPDELAELYRSAACLVFPSLYEGFGLPPLEAMACGTPVVAARTTSIPEVVGDAAILVKPRHPSALAGGIERAIADRERLVALGREQAARFSWRTTAEGVAELYRRVLGQNGA
jgi:glycosyltransferase involved in cell wall biosynthesis